MMGSNEVMGVRGRTREMESTFPSFLLPAIFEACRCMTGTMHLSSRVNKVIDVNRHGFMEVCDASGRFSKGDTERSLDCVLF